MKFHQLHMRKTNFDNLPLLNLKAGFGIHSHIEGQEKMWEDIVEKSFGKFFPFKEALIDCGFYQPSNTLYVTYNGKEIATGTASEHKAFPGEGWFRMVATVPEARGTGAGRLICEVMIQSLVARGYKTIALATDDDRIPAITLYLSLGFEPIIFDDEHKERWAKVMEQIKK